MLNLPHIFIISSDPHCLDSFLMTQHISPIFVEFFKLFSSVVLYQLTNYTAPNHYYFLRKYYQRLQIYFLTCCLKTCLHELKVFCVVILSPTHFKTLNSLYVQQIGTIQCKKGAPCVFRPMWFSILASGTWCSRDVSGPTMGYKQGHTKCQTGVEKRQLDYPLNI